MTPLQQGLEPFGPGPTGEAGVGKFKTRLLLQKHSLKWVAPRMLKRSSQSWDERLFY